MKKLSLFRTIKYSKKHNYFVGLAFTNENGDLLNITPTLITTEMYKSEKEKYGNRYDEELMLSFFKFCPHCGKDVRGKI